MKPSACLRPGDAVSRFDVGVRALAEGQVSGDEPHLVVAADADVRLASLVETVRHEEPGVQMTECHLADVLHHELLHVREGHLGEQSTLGLDLAGDGEEVPERLAETVAQQHPALLHGGDACAAEQRGIGIEEFTPASAQRLGPGLDRHLADERPRRHVGAVGQEPAVHAAAGHHLRCDVVVIPHQFLGRVPQRCHVSTLRLERRRARGGGRAGRVCDPGTMRRDEILLGGPNEERMSLARAVRVGPYISVGGTAPIAADGSNVDPSDIAAQAERCYEIIGEALARAGASPADVVRTRTLLVDITDQPVVSAVRKRWLGDTKPVDTIVEVSRFVDAAWQLEIEVDAIVPSD